MIDPERLRLGATVPVDEPEQARLAVEMLLRKDLTASRLAEINDRLLGPVIEELVKQYKTLEHRYSQSLWDDRGW